jgi:hypothetical protein
MFIKSDGGLAATGLNEQADCTVRSVAIAAEIPYMAAHTMMKLLGRKYRCASRRGVIEQFFSTKPRLGRYTIAPQYLVPTPTTTVGKFLERRASGRFIVRVRGHVFAVVDGVVHDSYFCGRRKRVTNIRKLEAL